MRLLVALVVLLGIPRGAPVLHSMKYFSTASSQVPNFPEFVSVGYVDELQITHYDSNTRRYEPKQDWMNKITEEDPEYWKRETEIGVANEQVSKVDIETVKQRLNKTGGVHIKQRMYGCEWDDETGEIKSGLYQSCFDGEEFIYFDLKTETYVAPVPEAVITKHKWESNRGVIAQQKNFITNICAEYLKKHVKLGKSSLMRKDLPSVALLQKTPSSPVTCHATGFYPHRADLFWTRDGEELHGGVVRGETLPNHDGSFQTSVDLLLDEVKEEDWGKYSCVFHLAGGQEVVTPLDKDKILTNWRNDEGLPVGAVVGIVVGVLLALICVIIGLIVWKKKNPKGFKPAGTSETSSSSGEVVREGSSEDHSMLPTSA
ncbi:unnamed protein product [Ophioblennius macclurei]